MPDAPEACVKTGWQVHALCQVPNHFHLVVETLEPNLVAGMKWFLGLHGAADGNPDAPAVLDEAKREIA